MGNRTWILLAIKSPEMGVAMIDAAARVYAAGLQASNSTSGDIRRENARKDVDDFLSKIAELGS